ncbi:hypothetical protein BHM03_00034626 [Ensete ventricosum]|nr:hypothetical protein BHM03_00034626 [Ensete ventricosum]
MLPRMLRQVSLSSLTDKGFRLRVKKSLCVLDDSSKARCAVGGKRRVDARAFRLLCFKTFPRKSLKPCFPASVTGGSVLPGLLRRGTKEDNNDLLLLVSTSLKENILLLLLPETSYEPPTPLWGKTAPSIDLILSYDVIFSDGGKPHTSVTAF